MIDNPKSIIQLSLFLSKILPLTIQPHQQQQCLYACTSKTDHLLTLLTALRRSEPVHYSDLVKPFMHISLSCSLVWLYSTHTSDVMASPTLGRCPNKKAASRHHHSC